MDDNLAKRVGAAAAAGWWTILIGAAWITGAWLVWMALLYFRPDWMLSLWGGGGLRWDTIQMITLWVFGAMKVVLLLAVLTVIWLTLWAGRLRRQQPKP